MTKVNIKKGFYSENVFYKMQILFEKNRNIYILFTNWGRIGWAIGQHQHTPFVDKISAIKEFSKIFFSKTGNLWEDKKSFHKKSKKYQLLNISMKKKVQEFITPFNYE